MAVWNVIDHTEVGASGAGSWSKDSISGSYDHLYFVAQARSDDAGGYIDECKLVLNDDTAANYSQVHIVAGTGTPSSGYGSGSGQTSANDVYVTGPNGLADTFGVLQMWILDYTSTSKYKQILSLFGCPNSSTTNFHWFIGQTASLWRSTAAITKMEFSPEGGGSDEFVQYSSFTLYGINGAV
tara:strand:- start:370 stop:918 length:549 start_codon:yes stop_codon:yes gene_type:complete